MMELEPGDEYLRRIAAFIRTHEKNLAESGLYRRRRPTKQTEPPPSSVFNPLAWFGPATQHASPPKPLVLSMDTHHLFYILIRLEALGINVGTLDVRVDSPSRPMSYINIFRDSDKSDTLSLASFRSSLSAVSSLSLGGGWWKRPDPLSIDAELKYIYSSFTKLPALSILAPGRKVVTELADEPPNENALPLDAFKNIQSLECLDIDPRTLLGWDKLAESLRVLTIKRSGLEDVSDIFIGAIMDDQARREGNTSRARHRWIHRGARQVSYVTTKLPDCVVENAEEVTPTAGDAPPSPPLESLPPHKWSLLKHLSLSDNALTFIPNEPLSYLTSVTHLDLSSNLLVSVPSGLSVLHNLISLNLSDNMIDSVLGIYTSLGQVLTLNLSRNRLESLCGLERLPALERVDLRHNRIDESAEVGRLATLPNIAEVWAEGNPFVESEENYRVSCFDYFWKEGKTITLDGSHPGFYEKRNLQVPPPEQILPHRPLPTAHSPPVIAVGANPSPKLNTTDLQKTSSLPSSSVPSQSASPQLAALSTPGKGRKRKNKRIVELEGETERNVGSAFQDSSHARMKSDASSKLRVVTKESSPARSLPPDHTETALQSEVPESLASAPLPEPVVESPGSPSRTPVRSRHSRHRTEYLPESSPPSASTMSPGSVKRINRGSATFSSRSATRRARVSASVYEPPSELDQDPGNDAEAFRKQIEALRSDMGEGWLKVFSQTHGQLGSTGVASE